MSNSPSNGRSSAPILVPSPSNEANVRVFPDEWRAPLRVADLASLAKARDLALEYRILRVLTETDRMQAREFREESSRAKNRYRDMVPFCENRVLLSDGSYINASYMKNFDQSNPKRFIASQGPLTSTIDDHWDMVWTEGVRTILTIGKLAEGTTEKIALYWPTDKHEPVVVAGPTAMTVSLLEERAGEPEGLTTRVLEVVTKCGDKRTVIHHHFEAWPDHGAVPPSIMILLASIVVADRGAVLVHCSAGVGRTGSVLAVANCVENIQHQLNRSGGDLSAVTLSVLATVEQLRDDRVHIVERTWQYESVYQAVIELASKFQGGLSFLPPRP
jgi:protein tyrosine phosphatase